MKKTKHPSSQTTSSNHPSSRANEMSAAILKIIFYKEIFTPILRRPRRSFLTPRNDDRYSYAMTMGIVGHNTTNNPSSRPSAINVIHSYVILSATKDPSPLMVYPHNEWVVLATKMDFSPEKLRGFIALRFIQYDKTNHHVISTERSEWRDLFISRSNIPHVPKISSFHSLHSLQSKGRTCVTAFTAFYFYHVLLLLILPFLLISLLPLEILDIFSTKDIRLIRDHYQQKVSAHWQ